MRTLAVLLSLVALALARPGYLGYPYSLSTQYHAQDALGQYSYGYAGGPSAKSEVKSWDGVTRGGYSYVDAEGKLQSVSYTADPVNGFRVAATNLPKAPAPVDSAPLVAPEPVQDTPEVAAAKAAHLAALAGVPTPLGAPEPVKDTPEVAAAKAEHLAAVERAAVAAAAAPEVPLSLYSGLPLGAGFAYSSVAPEPYLYRAAPWW
ncbi:cuticle protein 6-like [Bacillus rossius redtenbacheri]|uniref:cuticle protein 6-like n=1 Tax=Bacillus rossius redtenbacheri TaxID=93214 RepID=UPI002FDD43D4